MCAVKVVYYFVRTRFIVLGTPCAYFGVIAHIKAVAFSDYLIIIRSKCAYACKASAAGATYTSPCFAIRICCGCLKQIAIRRLAVTQNNNTLRFSGGYLGSEQLLRLVYARLLVRSAIGIGCRVDRSAESTEFIGAVKMSTVICGRFVNISDYRNASTAALGQKLFSERFCCFAGVGKLAARHTAGAVNNQHHVGGGFVVFALNFQGHFP